MKKDIIISVICCYNDYKQYKILEESLKNQNVIYELIGIDNINNRYKSASEALNTGALNAKGDILVFLHQDIVFRRSDSLREFVNVLNHLSNPISIIGIYGAKHKKSTKYLTNEYNVVDTLDECCIAMSKETWQQFKFNKEICDGWHLYAVELCIRIRMASGLVVQVKDCNIEHLSDGNVDEKYMATFKRLLVNYKNELWIATTCKTLPNNIALFNVYYYVWKIKRCLFGNYKIMSKIKEVWK